MQLTIDVTEQMLKDILITAVEGVPKRHLTAVLSGNADAENADVVLQFAVLGECVYG